MTLERDPYRSDERRTIDVYAATDHHMGSAPYQLDDSFMNGLPTVNSTVSSNQQGSASSFVDDIEVGYISGVPIYLTGRAIDIYESARRQHLAAYAIAFVSLFIGGVSLGLIALVLAIFARKKFLIVAGEQFRESAMKALRNAGTIVVAACGVVLALNVMSLIAFAPIIVSAIQSGDIASLLPFVQQPTTTGGGPIFG